MSFRPFLATDGPLPPGSRLFGLFLLLRFFSGGDLLCAVQERAQCHSAEHISMGLLNELHQLADVTVQTLGWRRVTKWERGMCQIVCARQKDTKKIDSWSLESGWYFFTASVKQCVFFHMHICIYVWCAGACSSLSRHWLQLVSGWPLILCHNKACLEKCYIFRQRTQVMPALRLSRYHRVAMVPPCS